MMKTNLVQNYVRLIQSESAPKSPARIQELIDLGGGVGAPDAVLGNLELYLEARVAAEEAEARAKGRREEAGEAWRRVLRSTKGEELDLFDSPSSEASVPVADVPDDLLHTQLCEDLIDRGLLDPVRLQRLESASAVDLEGVLVAIEATRGDDLTYGDCLNVMDIAARIDALVPPSMVVSKAPEAVCAMVREARERGGRLHEVFLWRRDDEYSKAGFKAEIEYESASGLVDALIGLMRLVKLNDLTEDQIERIECISEELLENGYAVPEQVQGLFGWVKRYRKQQEQELKDAEPIVKKRESMRKERRKQNGEEVSHGGTKARGKGGEDDSIPEFAREMWEALNPMTQGNVQEIVFFRDSEDEVVVRHGAHGLCLNFRHARGWHLGIFEPVCYVAAAVVLAIHELESNPDWTNSQFEARSLALARLLEEARIQPDRRQDEWARTRLFGRDCTPWEAGVWEMVLLKHRKQATKDGSWRLRKPRAKAAKAEAAT